MDALCTSVPDAVEPVDVPPFWSVEDVMPAAAFSLSNSPLASDRYCLTWSSEVALWILFV